MSDANDVGARDTTQDLQQTLNLIIKSTNNLMGRTTHAKENTTAMAENQPS